MRADDFQDAEERELDLRKAGDRKVAQTIKEAAKRLGFDDAEINYDSYAGDNYVLLFRSIADMEDLMALSMAIRKNLLSAEPKITIEDGELKLDF